MQPFIKNDDGVGAQALLDQAQNLSPEAQTEWQHKVAWIYYLSGDDASARAMAIAVCTCWDVREGTRSGPIDRASGSSSNR